MNSLGKHIGNEELRAAIEQLKADMHDPREPEAYAQIEELESVIEFCDWREDPEYIREDWFFGGYCQFLAESIYDLPAGWPCNCIDWGKAAEQLLVDYKQISILGETYYVRS